MIAVVKPGVGVFRMAVSLDRGPGHGEDGKVGKVVAPNVSSDPNFLF